MAPIKGKAMACDITDEKAPKQIADFVKEHFEGIDLVIHNAGITRDKTLGNMPEHFWDMTIAVNLTAEELIDEELIHQELLRENGRIVCISSISGIAGNFGQTNYACAKAGIAGMTRVWGQELSRYGIRANAIAPVAKTRMTEDIDAVDENITPDVWAAELARLLLIHRRDAALA